MKNHRLLVGIALLALAACSAGQRGPGIQGGPLNSQERERLLPPQGDPGKVAATDIAFARAALDEGQWTAFARFAASDAVMHGADGLIEAGPWLTSQQDPVQSVSWSPTAVWSSCDGSLAVSFGKFQEPEGIFGTYATVWELRGNGDYQWTYILAGIDNPQPPPPPPEIAPSEDVIIVPGLDSIEGRVADCPPRGQSAGQPEVSAISAANSEMATSRDSSLAWRWAHDADGSRQILVDYLRDGEWQKVLDFAVPAAAE